MSNNCKICNKNYSSYKSLWNHKKNIHSKESNILIENNKIYEEKIQSTLYNENIIESNIKNKCNICSKIYSSYISLWSHKKRMHNPTDIPIIIDESKLIYKCKFCDKKFDSCKTKWYHQNKICSIKNNETNIILVNENKSDVLVNENKSDVLVNENKSDVLVNENKSNIQVNENKSNIGLLNNGSINNCVININNFSNDNIDYVSENFIKRMFSHFLDEKEYSLPIPKLLENIKFNPNHKENNNVKITNMRSQVGLKYNNDKWTTVDKDELVNDMFKIGVQLFVKYYKEKNNILSDDMKECYNDFKKISYKNQGLSKSIKNKIEKIAYIYTKNIQLDN
jgi:hypothetical protein